MSASGQKDARVELGIMVVEGLRGVGLEAVAFVGVSFHLRVLRRL
jgi:hypothetical protein